MQSYLCLTVRFLQPYYHGRGDGGELEWPPSPLRVFQSLLAAAGRQWPSIQGTDAAAMFRWLETLPCSLIVTPQRKPSSARYRLYVPDNVGDKVAKAWARGNDGSIADYRTEKDVASVHFDGDALHYLYSIASSEEPPLEKLKTIARSVTHLGWGIDMAVGDASICSEEEVAALHGERWMPTPVAAGSTVLRTPVAGTLDDLCHRHKAFLDRIGRDERGNESFKPVPPLAAFRLVGYRRDGDVAQRPVAAFSLLKPDATAFRAFDLARQGLTVAAMMRYATKNAAQRARPDDIKWIDSFVLGHGEQRGERHVPVGPGRFSYIPLPSIEVRGEGRASVVGPIRRVLVAVLTDGHRQDVDWVGKVLSGAELIDKRSEMPQATLSRLPTSDRQVQRYLTGSAAWATVTPMVLPGYDDCRHYRRRLKDNSNAENQKLWLGKLHNRIDSLIRKAIGQAGFPDVLKKHAIIDWSASGFWPGTDLASHYGVPDHLRQFPRYHVRIEWRDADGKHVKVPGPISIGAGRFFGLGLFAALNDGG